MILQTVNDTFRSGNVMGFLGCGDERLIIESRFCGESEDYFFQYLLDRVLDFPNIVDLEADANQDNRLFNFLLFLFPYYLKTAMRKGPFKKYIQCQYNDGNVKGTIDIARHIKWNTPFVGNVAYSQREFSYDNSLMELVRHTIEWRRLNSAGVAGLRRPLFRRRRVCMRWKIPGLSSIHARSILQRPPPLPPLPLYGSLGGLAMPFLCAVSLLPPPSFGVFCGFLAALRGIIPPFAARNTPGNIPMFRINRRHLPSILL